MTEPMVAAGLAAMDHLLVTIFDGDEARRRARWVLQTLTRDPAPAGRDRDGRRTAPLAPSGVPIEIAIPVEPPGRATGPSAPESTGLSVSDSIGMPAPGAGGAPNGSGLRYTAMAGTRHRFLADRLRSQRAAVDELAEVLPAPAAASWRAVADEVFGALFDDPAALPPRARLATGAGVEHDHDGHVRGARLYAHLRLDRRAVERAATGIADVAPLVDRVRDIPFAPLLVARQIGIGERGESLASATKLYGHVPDGAGPAALAALGVPVSDGALDRIGLPAAVLRDRFVLCIEGSRPTVHLRGAALTRRAVLVDDVVRARCPERHTGLAGLDAAAAGAPWSWTVLGVAFAADGEGVLRTAYAAPDGDAPGPVESLRVIPRGR